MTDLYYQTIVSGRAEPDNLADVFESVVPVARGDMGDARRVDGSDAGACGRAVELVERFVEKQNSRLPVQCARKQDPLALSAGQCGAEISDTGQVAHREAADRIVNRRLFGAMRDTFMIRARIQSADVIGDRTVQEHVILHHGAREATKAAAGMTEIVTIEGDAAPARID